jgi:hypothetical protein
MHTKADEPELIRLWSEHSGWDQVSAEAWAHRMLHPPFGEAAIAVATDGADGPIVGQFAFIPVRVAVDGREISALRPFAPILSSHLRTPTWSANPLKHPVAEMYMQAAKAWRQRGAGFIYMIPDPRWRGLFRLFPMFTTGSMPLWSLPLPVAQPPTLAPGYSVAPLAAYDERVDRLWALSSRLHGCQIVRNAQTLPWKIGSGDYHVTAIERDGELVGLAASRPKGDRQWLICDLLVADADETLRATLIALIGLAQQAALDPSPEKPVQKIALLVTPPFAPVVRELGFVRDSYDFPIVIHLLDPAISKADVAPARWYVSPND